MLADGRRLDDVLGNGFALITTARPTARAARGTRRARRRLSISPSRDGELADWLRRGRATAAIVRPDRTVMCAGRDMQHDLRG